jgi:hypothetical protein
MVYHILQLKGARVGSLAVGFSFGIHEAQLDSLVVEPLVNEFPLGKS